MNEDKSIYREELGEPVKKLCICGLFACSDVIFMVNWRRTPEAIVLGNLIGHLHWGGGRDFSSKCSLCCVFFVVLNGWTRHARTEGEEELLGYILWFGTRNNDEESRNRIPGSLSRVRFLNFSSIDGIVITCSSFSKCV